MLKIDPAKAQEFFLTHEQIGRMTLAQMFNIMCTYRADPAFWDLMLDTWLDGDERLIVLQAESDRMVAEIREALT